MHYSAYSFKVIYYFIIFGYSHERVLESITEEADKRDIERFHPLLAGMNNQNIALKVKPHTNIYSWTVTFTDINKIYPDAVSNQKDFKFKLQCKGFTLEVHSNTVFYCFQSHLLLFSGWLYAADQCLDQPRRRVGLQDPYSLWTAETWTQGTADGTLLLIFFLYYCSIVHICKPSTLYV